MPAAVLLAGALVAAVAGLALLLGPGAGLARRAAALAGAPGSATAGRSQPRLPGLLASRLGDRLRRLAPLVPELGDRLARAGWRNREAQAGFLALLCGLPVLLALAGAVLAPALAIAAPLPAAAAGAACGLLLPLFGLGRRIAAREEAVRRAFPDFLDLLVICVEAGLSLDAALKRVAQELGPAAPVLADEIGLTAIELSFLPDRADAFANLARRVDVPEVRALLALVQQTERYGTPLVAALRVQASEGREAAFLRVEERAARLPVLLTVPMILFILPPLFIILVGPVALQLLAG